MDEDDSKDNDNAAKDGNQVSKYGDYLNPNLTQLAFKGSIGALFNFNKIGQKFLIVKEVIL